MERLEIYVREHKTSDVFHLYAVVQGETMEEINKIVEAHSVPTDLVELITH